MIQLPWKGVCDLRTVASVSEITVRVGPSVTSFHSRVNTAFGNATGLVYVVISNSSNAQTGDSPTDCTRWGLPQSGIGLGLVSGSPEGDPRSRFRATTADRRSSCGGSGGGSGAVLCNLQRMPPRLVYAVTHGQSEGYTAGIGGNCNVCK